MLFWRMIFYFSFFSPILIIKRILMGKPLVGSLRSIPASSKQQRSTRPGASLLRETAINQCAHSATLSTFFC